jgi:hypothetical protein
MKFFAFALLTIAGAVAGLVVGSQTTYAWQRQNSMMQMAIAGTIAGMIAGGIGVWLTGDKKKPD